MPVELAQQICKRSSELSAADEPHDVARAALSLVRIANQDTTLLDHASTIFRTRLRIDPADEAAKDGLRLLRKVRAFLG
jgi:hypothetical protein